MTAQQTKGPPGPPPRGWSAALEDPEFRRVAQALSSQEDRRALAGLLALGHAIARVGGDDGAADRLAAELNGYGDNALEVPPVRRVSGLASAFPVRALELGLLDPEEILAPGNEKFSQIQLTIGQAAPELEQALSQVRSGGVLALRVPASEVTHRSAETDADTEVYIYILPREVQKIVDAARALAVEALVDQVVASVVDG